MKKILLLISIGLLSACGHATEKTANPFEEQILVGLENSNNQFHFQQDLLKIRSSTNTIMPNVDAKKLKEEKNESYTITNVHVKKQDDTYVVTGDPNFEMTFTKVGERLYTTTDGEEYKTIMPQ